MKVIMNKLIILDRDGTVNVEKNYLYRIEDFEYTYKAKQAIQKLKNNNFKIVIITNQAGVARGYYTENDLNKLHNWINNDLSDERSYIDKFYYCPHHPLGLIEGYNHDCKCRKPSDKLYKNAIVDFDVDVKKSYSVGDKISDLIPAKKNGFKTILVKTGYGKDQEKESMHYVDYICDNLYEASKLIEELERSN